MSNTGGDGGLDGPASDPDMGAASGGKSCGDEVPPEELFAALLARLSASLIMLMSQNLLPVLELHVRRGRSQYHRVGARTLRADTCRTRR